MKTAYLLIKAAVVALLFAVTATPSLVSASSIETINNVSIVQRKQIDKDHLQLTIALGTRRETLLLEKNPAFQELIVVDQHGRQNNTSTTAYLGTVAGITGSWARVAITGETLDGVLDTGTQRLYITSASRGAPGAETRHPRSIRDRAVDKIIFAPSRRRNPREVVEIPVRGGFDTAADGVTRVARIAIVVDSLYDEALGGRGLSQAISTINTVDGIYQQEFGLALKVETAIIITDSETLDLRQLSLEDNLTRFREYRLTASELANDLALVHLFSGVRTEDPSVGLAFIDSACREDGYDVSMSTPFEFPVLLAAHEIGHNLGAQHDDETELCSLTDELLMHSRISNLTTNQFSVCSRNAVVQHLEEGACYLAAIDLSLTLTNDGAGGVIALITNTDPERAFPSADLAIQLKNASIAAAPASCNIDNVSTLNCIIPTTLPGENQTLDFAFRYEEAIESTVDATLTAIGFVDTKTINNYAQIVQPAAIESNDALTIAGNADGAPAETGAGSNSTPDTSGGGAFSRGLFVLLCAPTIVRLRRRISL
jgi:hypothetical protein